jgi:hypothetical protein
MLRRLSGRTRALSERIPISDFVSFTSKTPVRHTDRENAGKIIVPSGPTAAFSASMNASRTASLPISVFNRPRVKRRL